jgi:tetratricopeptide (TPR) repeat protein
VAIKGSLVEASLPEVIKLLAYSLKSGCLSVTDGRNFGNIFLKNGQIIYATMLNRAVRLGDTMVSKNLFEQQSLDQALRVQKEKKKRIGEILVDTGIISRSVLEQELRQQIEETIFTMLTWESGYFNFEENLLPASDEFTIRLSVQELLLASSRRVKEWQIIENKLPPFETLLIRSENIDESSLSETEKKVLALVDGNSSIDDAIKGSGFDFYEACKAIFVLMAAGFVEKPKKPTERKRVPGNMREHKNIGFASYKTARYDEAVSEFSKVLENEPDDTEVIFYLGLTEIKRNHLGEAKGYLAKALALEPRVSILINLGYLCNRLGLFDDAIKYLEQARALEQDNVKVNLNQGVIRYEMGELKESARTFEHSLALSQDVAMPYYYLFMICVKENDTEGAIEWSRQAIDKFPRLVAFKNNLAILYESIGNNEEAERLYCQVLDAEPDASKVVRNLADFYYRLGIYGAAREHYERIPDAQRDAAVLENLGHTYLLRGDKQGALNLWARAQTQKPDDKGFGQAVETLRALTSTPD